MPHYLRTLGGLSLHEDGPEGEVLLGTSKPLALTTYVATCSGHSAARSHLAELFWPDAGASHARRSLRQAIYYLSKRAGGHLLVAEGGRLRLDRERVTVDLWRFDEALSGERWEEAADLCRGPFLARFEGTESIEFEHWAEARQERIWSGLKVALHRLVSRALERGDAEEAVARARRLTELNPFDEPAQAAFITALVARGDRIAALQAYEAYRALLATELGDTPGRQLEARVQELREALLRAPPEIGRPPTSPPSQDDGVELREAAAAGPTTDGAAVDVDGPTTDGAVDGPTTDGDAADAESAPLAAAERAELVAVAARRLARRAAPRWFTLGAVAGVALAVLGVALWSALGGITAEAGDGVAPAYLYASFEGLGLQRIAIGDSTAASVDPTDLPDGALLSPSGRQLVWGRRVPDGTDLFLRPVEKGEPRRLTRRPDDEHPLAWSPDERYVLYWFGGSTDGGRTYHRHLAVHDLETGRGRPLPSGEYPQRAGAAWSPDGTWIAAASIRDGDTAVVIFHPDGSGLRQITSDPAPDVHPAWSPDGRWLAFSSRRNGQSDIFIVRPDGSGLQRITTGLRDETQPLWVTSDRIVYASAVGDRERRLEAVRLSTGRVRILSTSSAENGLVWLRSLVRPTRASWVEELQISPRPARASPGEWIAFRARVRDALGDELSPTGFPVRWRIEGADSAVVDGDRLWRMPAEDVVQVAAEVPGWRRDVLALPIRSVRVRAAPVLLREDWSDGVVRDRWRRVGEPASRVVRRSEAAAPWTDVFENNGDRHYDSGVISRRSFPLEEGLTLEVWGRLLATGTTWQQLAVGFKSAVEPEGHAEWSALRNCLFGVEIQGARPAETVVTVAGGSERLPRPESPGAWHRYTLQLSPDGDASFLVDGEVFWRSPEPVSLEEGMSVYPMIGGRSVGSEVLHGPVTVHRGEKYIL